MATKNSEWQHGDLIQVSQAFQSMSFPFFMLLPKVLSLFSSYFTHTRDSIIGDNYHVFHQREDCDRPMKQWYYPHFTEAWRA